MKAASEQALAPTLPQVREGRLTEFLLVGGATPLLFLLSWLVRQHFDLDPLELGVGFTMFWAAHVINDPHFSVTYLLFYRQARERALGGAFPAGLRVRYWLAGVVAPLLLLAWGGWAIAVQSAATIGALLQTMFLLVGWHYVKQGFGVALVLSARRGVRFTASERRSLLLHCLSAWIYAWANPATPTREVIVKDVVYMAWSRPAWLETAALAALLGSGAWLCTCLVKKRLREGSLPLATPLMALLCATWAWSILAHADPLVRYIVPALHAIQYLYFVALLEGNEAREKEGEPWFGPPVHTRLWRLAATSIVLGWLLFDGVPGALDDLRTGPNGSLGATPWVAVLYAFVNIHHYLMDGVIWRREQPGTRYLFD